jgi:hypothetical protein
LKGHQPLSIIKMAVEAKVKACRVELLAQRWTKEPPFYQVAHGMYGNKVIIW